VLYSVFSSWLYTLSTDIPDLLLCVPFDDPVAVVRTSRAEARLQAATPHFRFGHRGLEQKAEETGLTAGRLSPIR